MKKALTRAAALALAVLLAAAPIASASQALGTELHHSRTILARGVSYINQYLWSATYSDMRNEHYLEYSPNDVVQPAVSYGGSVLSTNTLSTLAQSLENQGKRVLGGMNGDYFVMATGEPLGIVITNGIMRSSSADHYALGFDANGRAFIGWPNTLVTANFHGSTRPISCGLNKVRLDTGGYVLYTSDYASTTNHTASGIDVILAPSAENLGQPVDPEGGSALRYSNVPIINGRIRCTVEQVLHSSGSISIPAGKLVLSINNKSSEELVNALASLQPGEEVDIDISCADTRWESAVTAIGGLYKMVTNGVVESGLETAQAPRTAVGIKADGTVVFYTVDGRQSGYSVGAAMTQVAQRLVELGCVEAMCLDGGGSTTFGATLPGQNAFSILNKPSEGTQRRVTNALFLTANSAPAGPAEALLVNPGHALMLANTPLSLTASGLDAIGQTAALTEPVTFEVPDGAGTISGGYFTSGYTAGSYTLTARSGDLTGPVVITVVPTPDKITILNQADGSAVSSVSLQPGGQIDLTASAVWYGMSVRCADSSFTWSVTDGLGSIDSSGLFTAGSAGGTGSIQVSAGGRTATVPLSVAGHVLTVEDFEGSFDKFAGVRLEPETQPAYVRYGAQSARLTYDLSDAGYASAALNLPIQTGETRLSLWVYGDGSDNTLAARGADGTDSSITLTTLSFTGWQRVSAALPAGLSELSLMLLPTGSSQSGTIWLDQITTSNQDLTDDTPPTVEASVSGGALTASLKDNVDQSFSQSQLTVTYDGQPLSFTASGTSLTASLPAADGAAHRVTVTATDASGNIGRASADIAASAGRREPFSDTNQHWAETYINYLYDQGISTGIPVGNTLQFQPNKNITRGEFVLMAANWLRLDPAAYSGVELPFADAASIPSWALNGVKAMYALGCFEGSEEVGGVYAYAERTITRAEAMTMLGRIQAKGYASAELSFSDAGDVPAWAADYVKTLVAQGVVSGYDSGIIAPNALITRGEIAKILYSLR